MSIAVQGFNSSAIFQQIKDGLAALPAAEKQAVVKKVNGVFEMVVKNAEGKEQSWTLDFKQGSVTVGKPQGKADITISLGDQVFLDLAAGKINGQKAFMSGKLKIKGNMMLAMRLDTVLSSVKNAPKPAAAPAPKPAAAAAPAAKATTSVAAAGFSASALFEEMAAGIASAPEAEKQATMKKVKAIFQFDIKNKDGQVQSWVLDLKNKGEVILGTGPKPDVTIAIADKDFVDLAAGKLNGQKAFMTGKLKIKGAIMLATKLDTVLRSLRKPSKL